MTRSENFSTRRQDAIVAAAADELRSSSGSADGSPAPEAKPSTRGKGEKPKTEKPDERLRADVKKRKKDDAAPPPEEAPVELGPNGKPKLPRPEGIAPCPRCHSEETKFCYYNNYNVKQPRYFCRGCQRYWTAGGMLRNVPVGAGRRKNKNGANGSGENSQAAGAAAFAALAASAAAGGRGRVSALGGLTEAAMHAAAAAALGKRERRDGSSDGSATEAERDDYFSQPHPEFAVALVIHWILWGKFDRRIALAYDFGGLVLFAAEPFFR